MSALWPVCVLMAAVAIWVFGAVRASIEAILLGVVVGVVGLTLAVVWVAQQL